MKEFRDKEGGAWSMLADPKGRIALDYGVAATCSGDEFIIDDNETRRLRNGA